MRSRVEVEARIQESRDCRILVSDSPKSREDGIRLLNSLHSFGGWAVFRLGAQVYLPDGSVKEAIAANGIEGVIPLVDAISTAHPSWLTKEEIAGTKVPSQIIAPEHDGQLTPELKKYANETIPTLGVEYEYRYFPGLVHAFATKADEKVPGEKQGADRAKRAVAGWFLQILRD